MKRILFKVIMWLTRFATGKGLGRLLLLRRIYAGITKRLMLESEKIIELADFKIKVNSNHGLDGMTATLVANKTYEPMTTSVFNKILQKGMNVIDVGANIGYFTVLSAVKVGNRGKVIAVEPEPNNYEGLIENVELNHLVNVITLRTAASDRNDIGKLYVSEAECGEHSLLRGRPHIKNTIDVTLVKLDTLCSGDRIDFLKTDTEGNDPSVVLGSKQIIEQNRNIILITEFWLPGIEAGVMAAGDYWRMLQRMGFKYIYVIDEIRKQIVVGDLVNAIQRCQGGRFSVNLVCSRNIIDHILT